MALLHAVEVSVVSGLQTARIQNRSFQSRSRLGNITRSTCHRYHNGDYVIVYCASGTINERASRPAYRFPNNRSWSPSTQVPPAITTNHVVRSPSRIRQGQPVSDDY